MAQATSDGKKGGPPVEEAVSAVLASAATERHANPHAIGFVRSNSCALNTRDTTFTVPDFFPAGGVAWPEALLSLWKTVRYSSLIGVFVALSRAWFTVDNKLVLWDYQDGREFCLYDEIPELIVVVGAPLTPAPGAFQPHVTYVLPVATTSMLFLLGLCVVGQDGRTEMKVVNLGYSCTTHVTITKISGVNGRVFCAGADGHVYEVQYMRENTPFTPKIRLVSYKAWFAATPVVGQLASAVAGVWETWAGGAQGGLIDLAIDERDGLLFTLSEKSVIALWRIVPGGGLRHVLNLRHQPDRQLRSSAPSQGDAAPLIRLFVIDADSQGCRLAATALNGDQFRYRYVSAYDAAYPSELVLLSHTPTVLPPGTEVSVCYASASAFVAAFSDAADERASDAVLAATSPPSIMAPHQGARDVVTTVCGPSSRIVRVDAIDRLPSRVPPSPNDLCSQTCSPAPSYIIVHRHGLSAYTQARPVDTLYLILSSASAECRDALLGRFTAVYGSLDYVAMLFQIAIGTLNTASDVPRCFGSDGALASSGDGGVALSELGRRLSTADSVEAQRAARELLRSMQLPTTQSGSGAGTEAEGQQQQMTVLMSPFASGLVRFLARALSPLWDTALGKTALETVGAVSAVLSRLLQYLDSLSIGSFAEQHRAIDLPLQWQQDRVGVLLPRGRTLRTDDTKRLQAVMLYACYELAHRARQATVLLQRLECIPLQAEDAAVTLAQLLRDATAAQRLGRYVGQVLLDAQPGLGAATDERVAFFTQLQQQCPYFFGGISTQAYRLRSEIDAMTHGAPLQSLTEARMQQWAAEVGAKAAQYWPSGALQSICEQLRSLKRENIAVTLLLHAAAQLDPDKAALSVFLAEGSGQASEQLRGSSGYAIHQVKTQVLELVVSTLESAWLTHRSVADELLGGPHRSGAIWLIEPSDEYAHCFLFDWLCAPRDDAAVTRSLRGTLVAARSPFLASYLRRNAAVLGAEYAHYLAHVQGDYKAAVQQCFVMAQSPLLEVPVADRLPCRIRYLREALACAEKGHADQCQQVAQQLALMEAQQRLYLIAAAFISSGDATLDRAVELEGQTVTERDVALQHIDYLSRTWASASELIAMGGMYAALGGAEVQLDALLCANVTDAALYATCINYALQNRQDTTENITKRLIERYYNASSAFPLSYLVRALEARWFPHSPAGPSRTVAVLLGLGVDAKVLFCTYQALLCGKDESGLACEAFAHAGVTEAYLVHALATLLVHLAELSRRGSVQSWLVSEAMAAVRRAIQHAGAGLRSAEQQAAVTQADELLARASTIAHAGDLHY